MADIATIEELSRLLGRAAFGATPADLQRLATTTYEDAVGSLVDVPDPRSRGPMFDDARRVATEAALSAALGLIDPSEAQLWWLERMRTTPYPLEERMTLFLHNYFATSVTEIVNPGYLLKQNQLLRTHSLGSFRDLCIDITIDPAMLYWLNGFESSVGAVNENYAREFFELFSLGVLPQVYTENDVREAARVLTGWTVDFHGQSATFIPELHDPETKTVLGRTITNKGAQEYVDLVNLALAQDIAPLHLAYKLVMNFAYVPETTNLIAHPDPLVDKVAATLRATDWNLREAIRTLLLADEFRHANLARGHQVIRQPIELVVHACKVLNLGVGDGTILSMLARMNQKPFQPPNVGGWPPGRSWLSSATTLARYDWGVTVFNLWLNSFPNFSAVPAPEDLDGWVLFMGLSSISDNTRAALTDYLAARETADPQELQAGIFSLLLSSPEWEVI
ncbi:MAG TPA: DUF1800 domain-containing protein [Actinomycetota bacterium]|nr:DUF1800 domain-containing protein [Actinomycetota bacterium]